MIPAIKFLLTSIICTMSLISISGTTLAEPLDLAFPTPNKKMLSGGPQYYMYVDRTFQGRSYTPWEGGQFGFVRTPVIIDGKKVYKHFHEGIDVKPTQRSADGSPLDQIFAIDSGVVRHVNESSGQSNYGKYVVVEHDWSGSPVYSLYAHLASADVTPGQKLDKGQVLGKMGYTGRGINKTRSHLHLEIGLLFNKNFAGWHQTYFRGAPNHHGIFNGLNIFGMDVAALYQAIDKDPSTTIEKFVTSKPWFYKVRIPDSKNFQLPERYPWLVAGSPVQNPVSWEISFTANALPVKIEPGTIPASAPKLLSVKNSSVPYYYVSRGLLTGTSGNASLSKTGLRTMHLLTYPD